MSTAIEEAVEQQEQAPCGCVEDVIDYAGINLPITRRCDAHEAERKAQQREDALVWAKECTASHPPERGER